MAFIFVFVVVRLFSLLSFWIFADFHPDWRVSCVTGSNTSSDHPPRSETVNNTNFHLFPKKGEVVWLIVLWQVVGWVEPGMLLLHHKLHHHASTDTSSLKSFRWSQPVGELKCLFYILKISWSNKYSICFTCYGESLWNEGLNLYNILL